GGTVGLKVGGTGLQSVHHDGVLVQLALLVVNDDDALLVKGPADAALGAQVAVALVERVADLRRGALAVVGQGLHNDGHAAGAVALVGDGLVVVGAAGAQGPVDGALDVVVGHVDGLGLGDDRGQAGVVVGVAGAAALFHGHDDLLGDLGEGGGAL
ncbi:General stress protein 13, partial [Dysosmobacter welbionis]